MTLDPKHTVQQITALQEAKVCQWHETEIDNGYDDLLGIVCQQHQFNYLLWHEEDIARSESVSDQQIARVKRAIDRQTSQTLPRFPLHAHSAFDKRKPSIRARKTNCSPA